MSKILTMRFLLGKNRFIPKFSHLLSFMGIVIGVIALLIVSSVMNGLQDDMMKRIIDTKAEIRVYRSDRGPIKNYSPLMELIGEDNDVVALSPVVTNELLVHKGNNVVAVNCHGIDLNKHRKISDLDNQLRLGYVDSESFDNFGNNEIVLGLDLSVYLGVTVGEQVRISSPIKTEPTPLGLIPRSDFYQVVGIFSSGMPEYDMSYVYISQSNGMFFSGYDNAVDILQVKVNNPHRSGRVAARLQRILGNDYLVEDWSVFDRSIFEAMRLEKIVMQTVLMLMLIISGFNMSCSSIRLVSEKQREIGVLKALGMKTQSINLSFLNINVLICLSGIFFGMTLSAMFIFFQYHYRIIEIPVPGFPVHYLPVVVKISDFFMVGVIVILITIAATVIPLHKIRKTEPITIIRELV